MAGSRSLRKRSTFALESPHPPPALLNLYAPLIKSLSRTYPSLVNILGLAILSTLLSVGESGSSPISHKVKGKGKGKGKERATSQATLASWFVWIFDEALPVEERGELVTTLIKLAWESTMSVYNHLTFHMPAYSC